MKSEAIEKSQDIAKSIISKNHLVNQEGKLKADGQDVSIFDVQAMIYNANKKASKTKRNEIQDYIALELKLNLRNYEKKARKDESNLSKIADKIIRKHRIKNLSGRLYRYDKGCYIPQDEHQIRSIIYTEHKNLSKNKRMEVYDDILHDKSIQEEQPNNEYICFLNGLIRLDYDTGKVEMIEHTPNIICTARIPHKYNPSAPVPKILDNALNQWTQNDNEEKTLLYEMCGNCLTTDIKLGQGFVLTGNKSNGKSTFLDFLEYCIGPENTSSVDMGDFGTRFINAELSNKQANIADDIADTHLTSKSISNLKKLITGNTITCERKHEDPFKFRNYATIIFSCNDLPTARDLTGAVNKRLLIVPFDATFDESKKIIDLSDKLKDESCVEGFIAESINAYLKARRRNKYTIGKKVQRATAEYELNNNSVLLWASDYIEELDNEDALTKLPISMLYGHYTEYCKESGIESYKRTNFTRVICSHYKYESINKREGKGQARYFTESVTDVTHKNPKCNKSVTSN